MKAYATPRLFCTVFAVLLLLSIVRQAQSQTWPPTVTSNRFTSNGHSYDLTWDSTWRDSTATSTAYGAMALVVPGQIWLTPQVSGAINGNKATLALNQDGTTTLYGSTTWFFDQPNGVSTDTNKVSGGIWRYISLEAEVSDEKHYCLGSSDVRATQMAYKYKVTAVPPYASSSPFVVTVRVYLGTSWSCYAFAYGGTPTTPSVNATANSSAGKYQAIVPSNVNYHEASNYSGGTGAMLFTSYQDIPCLLTNGVGYFYFVSPSISSGNGPIDALAYGAVALDQGWAHSNIRREVVPVSVTGP